MEEVKLLTKKVYEGSLSSNKVEREIAIKDSLIEELYS